MRAVATDCSQSRDALTINSISFLEPLSQKAIVWLIRINEKGWVGWHGGGGGRKFGTRLMTQAK